MAMLISSGVHIGDIHQTCRSDSSVMENSNRYATIVEEFIFDLLLGGLRQILIVTIHTVKGNILYNSPGGTNLPTAYGQPSFDSQ